MNSSEITASKVNISKGLPKKINIIMKYKYIYLIMLPGMIFYLLFAYIPIYGYVLAFKDFMLNKGIMASPWIGLKNFQDLFSDNRFWEVTLNTVIIQAGRILFEFPVPIIIAILLNEIRVKTFKGFVQSVMYFPYFLSWIIMYTILLNIFSVDGGLLNGLLTAIGLDKINFLSEPSYFRVIVFAASDWKLCGYFVILYMAALSTLDYNIYEAALVDGSNRFQRIIHISLPGITSTIIVMLILYIANTMNAGFDSSKGFEQIFNTINDAVRDVGETIDIYVYKEGIQRGHFALTTAVGLFKASVNLVLLIAIDKISRKATGIGLYE